MFEEDNPLMTLCAVACTFRERDASTSGLQEQHVSTSAVQNQDIAASKAQRKTKTNTAKLALKSCTTKSLLPRLKEIYHAKIKLEEDIDVKSIPNHRITEYIENTSDELRRKFSYRCKFSPSVCSKVMKSYGNEEKAFNEIKRHLVKDHFLADLIPETSKKVKQDMTKSSSNLKSTNKLHCMDQMKPSKRFRSLKMVKSVPPMEFNGDKSTLQQPTEKTDKEENIGPLDTNFQVNDSTDDNAILSTIKFGEFEHTYAKNPNKLSNTISAVRETGQKKNRRQNSDLPVCKFDLNKHLNADLLLARLIIHTPPFPFIYTPYPLEAVDNVELDSNGDPVDVKEPVFVQTSTSRISPKKAMENKIIRKKSKFVLAVNSSRSVLECVENRVACKSNASSEQKDALLPDDSIENLENVEKSIHEIAWKNIRILSQQRKKRKYRDKPTVYICEICNKHFTANTSLTYHYLGHLKIKPFKCNICYRTFTRRHSLKYHMMIHANKNRFQCPTCKRLFRHPSHYKEHLRKHTGEEPFSCKFCSNKFKTRNSFKRHLKMQHQKLLTSNGIVPIRNDS